MKLIIAFFAFFLLGILSIVYVKISTPNVEYKNLNIKHKKKENIKQNTFIVENHFNFPARISYIKVDLRNIKYTELYRLKIDVNDKFTLFNIKALLKSLNVPFSMIEDKKEIKIYILFKNINKARKILSLFKRYNFKVKLQKITKRV